MYEVVVSNEGGLGWSVPLAARAVTIGRDPSNDIVFGEPSVSAHHAIIWSEAGAVWVKDLGSSNGTWIDGQRIRVPTVIGADVAVRFGAVVSVRIRAVAGGASRSDWVLEDVKGKTLFPLTSDRFVIGSGTLVDLRLDSGPDVAATVLVYGNGEVWLGVDGVDRPLREGDVLNVSGRDLRLSVAPAARAPTEVPVVERYRYRLVATLSGATGPEAEMVDLAGSASAKVSGGNRAILLFLLGKRAAEDRKAGRPPADVGWCPDDEVMSGLWGRHGDENKLHVLLHRVRADLKSAGFDPWFIEKRQRFVRARLAEVEIR